jgi:hypothetical protein
MQFYARCVTFTSTELKAPLRKVVNVTSYELIGLKFITRKYLVKALHVVICNMWKLVIVL